ncbi:MAG TPA: LacI family DNA-binding transcriptional regulator [Gammaproteobacteria bacterium]|nr:LacI family DNA-binding transcriptional regulator [Gammaproteobacteria bacterium]
MTGEKTERPAQRVRRAPRDKTKVTINDIARLANVSKKTVSRVINDSPLVREQTRAKVKLIISEHGFAPDPQARALAFRRSFLVALIYDNPSPQYVVNMQRGILDTFDGTSFQLIVRPCDRGDPRFHASMRAFVEQQKLFGAILPPSVSEDQELADILADAGCPYVRIASVPLDEVHSMIRTHDAEGAAAAARHIATLGHERIAHIRGPLTFRSSHERLRGFTEGLAEFGLALDAKLVLEGGYTFESGVACAQQLLERPPASRPTAIFAGNDEMAVGVYQAARRAGFGVPEDLSIVGFDDTPMASRIWPPLTTVRLPIREMGKAAAALLINEARGERTSFVEFQPEMIVRQSTAPLRK